MNPQRGLWAIVLIGALLRIVPIWFGLPYSHARPDEETAVGHAVAVLGGDLNPHFFHWPSLIFYGLAVPFAAASWIRAALSLDPQHEHALVVFACAAALYVSTGSGRTVFFRFTTVERPGPTILIYRRAR